MFIITKSPLLSSALPEQRVVNYTKTYTTTTNLCDHVIGTAEKHQQKAAHEEKKLKMD